MNSISSSQAMKNIENVIIIGSGPAGYTAALYAARANLNPLILAGDPGCVGGQLITTTIVENYPGVTSCKDALDQGRRVPRGIDGFELMENMRIQALEAGARQIAEKVVKIDRFPEGFIITTKKSQYKARSVIVASGAYAKRDDIPGTRDGEFWNKGVSACATCDGPLFRGSKRIIVIGGGDTAMEEALFLTRFTEEVVVVHRRDTLRASKVMAERALQNSKIKFYWNSRVTRVMGEEKMMGVCVENLLTDEKDELDASALFFAIGHSPNSDFVKHLVKTDEAGYIVTENGGPDTGIPGLFVAGDVADKEFRQAITSAGEGCKAAMLAVRYLESLH